MRLKRCTRYSIARAFIIAIYSSNWIFCAPSSLDGGNHSQDQISSLNADETEPIKILVEAKVQKDELLNNTKRVDNEPESQNFFQSFAPLFGNTSPLGHSRPLLYPDHSFKPSFKSASYRDLPFSNTNDNILGSGNFGVVKGGTYYAEDRDDGDFAADSEPYAYIGSVHGRVHRKKNPPPAFRNGGDFFAHFRDFADITAPSKSYSQYYVMYVRPNQSNIADETVLTPVAQRRPKNIIEQLSMLDETSDEPLKANESKQSKFKRKLAVYQSQHKDKEKAAKLKLFTPPKEISEPLIALS